MDTPNEEQGTALLQEAPLRELISARVISRVIAVGSTGGFVLEVHFGERKALLVDFHRILTHRFHLNLTHPETA
ncbi:hypothetical protein [Burkholderia multivorans]|nr:hypothetical protein [Burkholderia multivorans]